MSVYDQSLFVVIEIVQLLFFIVYKHIEIDSKMVFSLIIVAGINIKNEN